MGELGENRDSERRNFKRFGFKESVEFKVNDDSEVTGSLSGDLSEGGVRLRLFKFIPLHTQLNLLVHLDPEKIVEFQGKVVWVEEVPYTEYYQAGVEFTGDQTLLFSRREIRHFLQSHQLA